MRIGLYRAILAAIMLMHAAGAAGQIVALQTPGSKEVVIGNPLVSRKIQIA